MIKEIHDKVNTFIISHQARLLEIIIFICNKIEPSTSTFLSVPEGMYFNTVAVSATIGDFNLQGFEY